MLHDAGKLYIVSLLVHNMGGEKGALIRGRALILTLADRMVTRGYFLIWAMYVCAAPQGMVFQPF